jgi:hypothetical protein
VRFGTLGGAALGLLLTFGAAWMVDKAGRDPEWVLRAGSAAGLLGFGWLGRRLGAYRDGALYNALGVATGLLVAGAVAVLMLSAFGAAK